MADNPWMLTDAQKPRFPGTDWPIDWYSQYNGISPALAGPVNNMLYKMSGGKIAANPMNAGSLPFADPNDPANLPYQGVNPMIGQHPAGYGQTVIHAQSDPSYVPGYNPVPNPIVQSIFPQMYGSSTTQRTPLNAGIDSRLQANVANNSPTGPAGQAKAQSLTDFTKEFFAQRPSQASNVAQESGYVNSVYDPNGVQKTLADLSKQRTLLGRQAAQKAIQLARRDNNVARMGQGNSSYLDRAYGDSLGRILTDQAVQGNDQARQDQMYLGQQRSGLLGQRNQLVDAYLKQGLTLQQALDAAQGADLSNLYSASGVDRSNTNYTTVPGAPIGPTARSYVRQPPLRSISAGRTSPLLTRQLYGF